ncbi:hypothetical protein BPOR_0149g00090 [Botrytis porri]|uniref:Uncharacterized protein n=1 Tax=Botrytis porri TaxID=87229 RepID=A0A4Z1KVU7_9HELO|nr:hypothetical protein BPOR_0149g00090 [Botrytis porri]
MFRFRKRNYRNSKIVMRMDFRRSPLVLRQPPGEKELIDTGDLGMDILASVKAARNKLKDMRERIPEQESNEDLAEKKDE